MNFAKLRFRPQTGRPVRVAWLIEELCPQGVKRWDKPTGYKGSEGLMNLPGPKGEYGDDTIGFRTAGEAKSDSPAIDVNVDGVYKKIHFIH